MSPKPRAPWSRPKLHRQLLSLLDRPTTTLTARTKVNGSAATVDFDDNFPPRYVKVEIDLNNHEAVIPFVIHELVHVVLSELVLGKFDETLEEVMVVAISSFVAEWVIASPSRRTKWQKVIDRKLTETAAKLEPVPLEEQVAR
jgi:hypothetical protein